MRLERHLGIEIAEARGGAVELRPSDVVRAVEDLPVQIRGLDFVEVDEADPADAGGGEIERRGAAEPTGADDEHGAAPKLLLPFLSELREDLLTRVAIGGHGSR